MMGCRCGSYHRPLYTYSGLCSYHVAVSIGSSADDSSVLVVFPDAFAPLRPVEQLTLEGDPVPLQLVEGLVVGVPGQGRQDVLAPVPTVRSHEADQDS